MKIRFLLPLVFASAISTGFSTTILLNNFTNVAVQASSSFDNSWNGGTPAINQFIQSSNYVTIAPVNGGTPNGNGDFWSAISGTWGSPGAPVDLSTYNYLDLTARTNSGNLDTGFTVQLIDSGFNEAGFATFSSASLLSSFSTVQSAITLQGPGSINNIQFFAIFGDSDLINLNAVNASFQNLTADTIAVPEPATWAFLLVGFGLLFLNRRSLASRK